MIFWVLQHVNRNVFLDQSIQRFCKRMPVVPSPGEFTVCEINRNLCTIFHLSAFTVHPVLNGAYLFLRFLFPFKAFFFLRAVCTHLLSGSLVSQLELAIQPI